MITGTAVRLPFRVAAQSYPPTPGGLPAADPRRPVVDAAFIQQPILPRGLIAALTLALTLGAVGVAYAVKQAQRVPTAAPTASPLPGAPPAPSLTATKVDSHTIRLDWQSSDTPESYLLSHIEAATQETVAGNFSSKPVDGLQPGQSYCFQLQAVKAGLKSALSNKACATTDPLPASATPAGTTTSVQGIVPDVAQQTYEVAKSTLEQAGYQVRMFLEQSTTTGPGLVIRTYPAANVRLPPGSEVRVYVAS
jgi:hypothetical protein